MARPTKYVPETIDRVLSAIAIGAPFTHACHYAGISFETFNEWRKDKPEFSEQVKNAEGKAVVGWLERIEQAAKDGNWQAAAWKLERRLPEEFGRRERVQVDIVPAFTAKLQKDFPGIPAEDLAQFAKEYASELIQ